MSLLTPTDGPWTRGDAIRLATPGLAGVVCLVVSWALSAGEAHLAGQVGYGVAGVVGLIALYGAGVSWFIAGRRSIGLRMEQLLGQVPTDDRSAEGPRADRSGQLAAVVGLDLYHRLSCPMIQSREVVIAVEAAHVADGRTPCGVCAP